MSFSAASAASQLTHPLISSLVLAKICLLSLISIPADISVHLAVLSAESALFPKILLIQADISFLFNCFVCRTTLFYPEFFSSQQIFHSFSAVLSAVPLRLSKKALLSEIHCIFNAHIARAEHIDKHVRLYLSYPFFCGIFFFQVSQIQHIQARTL